MARAPNEKQIEAEKLFKKGYKLIDISKELDIPEGTIRSWKNRYNWNNDNNATLQKNEKKKRNVAKENNDITWIEIENEYVTDIRKKPCTLESLSKKFGISFSRIEKYARENEWTVKREKYAKSVREKAKEKTCDLISNDIAEYQAKHISISDKIFNEINKALDNPDELYTVVEKLRQGYGQGEFKESIETEVLEVINDAKVVNIVNALDRLQKMQRQTLGILDEKDKLRLGKVDALSEYEKEKQKLDLEYKKLQNRKLGAEIAKINGESDDDEKEDDGFIEALGGTAKEDWNDEEI